MGGASEMKSTKSETNAEIAQTKFLIDFDVLACPCYRSLLAFHLSQFFLSLHFNGAAKETRLRKVIVATMVPFFVCD